jgi:hypothetical protein
MDLKASTDLPSVAEENPIKPMPDVVSIGTDLSARVADATSKQIRNMAASQSERKCPDPLNSWTKLINQFSHLNLGNG